MPEIFINIAFGEQIPTFDKKINPLENGWVWIRGMDFLPVLIKESKLEEFENNMSEMKAKIIQHENE